jgi:hypothetical protein
MVTGIVNLAPEPLPITVSVVCSCVLVPNNVLTDVAVKLIVVPITVLDTLVPIVEVELSLSASCVLIPTPLKEFNTLTSAIVAVYPSFSKIVVAPK